MKTFLYSLCILLAITSMPSVAAIDNLSHAINESGRLRMLSQRMAKAYILKAMDVRPSKSQTQLDKSVTKFEQNVADLEAFAKDIQAPVAVSVSLGVVQQEWAQYKELLTSANSNDSATVSSLLALSDRTLMACEELVTQLEQVSQSTSARLVNVSGRQRMLSQRIAKFYSAISITLDQDSYMADLNLAVEEFEEALALLIKSQDNTHFVNHKLKKVQTQWKFSKQGFLQLEKGASTPLVISMTTETILKQMNDITALYQEIDSNKRKVAAN